MDTVIQIIIILVIVVSVLRRFREIGAKSKDIQTTKLPKPDIDLFDVQEPPEEPTAKQFPSPRLQKRAWEPPRPVEMSPGIDEDVFESRPEVSVSGAGFGGGVNPEDGSLPEIITRTKQPVMTEGTMTRLPHIPVLRFDQTQVVRGIIMSEILGPPVGLSDRGRF